MKRHQSSTQTSIFGLSEHAGLPEPWKIGLRTHWNAKKSVKTVLLGVSALYNGRWFAYDLVANKFRPKCFGLRSNRLFTGRHIEGDTEWQQQQLE